MKAGTTRKRSCTNSFPFTRRLGLGGDFNLAILDDRPGMLTFRASGKDADRIFQNEAGGHRWQRIPPNEKRGRVHTSTVTVACLSEPTEVEVRLDPRDLTEKTCRGSGAGGQHRNKTDSAVILTHAPTGLVVRCETERSQHANRDNAMRLLRARIYAQEHEIASRARAQDRKRQVGSGMRADKIRTVALQRNQVTDHRSGCQIPAKEYLRGELERLH